MTYRAKPVTQRDGTELQFSNCRMASGATGIDYDTFGKTTSTGAKMRSRSGDPSGGTTSDDIQRAWRSYGQTITIRDGKTFDDLIKDLKDGRLVHIDVWHEACGGPCLSGSGRYGHTMAVAPERSADGKWLVADPWCSPGKWKWWPEAKLRKGAEVWAQRVYGQATNGDARPVPVTPEQWRGLARAIIMAAVRVLMDRYDPEHPRTEDDPEPGDTSGPKPIMFTSTDAHGTGGQDVAIQAPSSLTSKYICKVPTGTAFYANADLSEKLGEFGSARELRYVGAVVGGKSRAVIVTTSKPYSDGVDRPTVVYVKEGVTSPVDVGMPPTPSPERDKQWRDWLSKDSDAPDKASTGGEPTEEHEEQEP